MTVLSAPERALNARRETRTSMFLAAVLRSGTEQVPVKVRNMSPNGALFDTSLALTVGAKVVLMRGALQAQGAVIWNSEGRCGIRFSSRVPVTEWLATHTKTQQQRVDDIVALVKSAGSTPPPHHLCPPEDRSPEVLAHELEMVIGLMQDMEDDLTTCGETLERHGMKLQNLDIAMQMLRAIAGDLVPAALGSPARVAMLRDGRRAPFPEY